MQVQIKENWVFYDKPEDRCIIRFEQDGKEVVRIVFNFNETKTDYIGGSLIDCFPITRVEEKQYLIERRQQAMIRTRNLKL